MAQITAGYGEERITVVTGANNGEREMVIAMMNAILTEWRFGNINTERAFRMAFDVLEAAMLGRKKSWNDRVRIAFGALNQAYFIPAGTRRISEFDFTMCQFGLIGLCWGL